MGTPPPPPVSPPPPRCIPVRAIPIVCVQDSLSLSVLARARTCTHAHAGEMYRRVITTVVYGDGTSRSTAQDYVLDLESDRWYVASAPFDYHGPGVGRSFGGGGRGNEAVGEDCGGVVGAGAGEGGGSGDGPLAVYS